MPIFARRGAAMELCWKGPAPSFSVGWQRGAAEIPEAAVSASATAAAVAVARQASIRSIAAQHSAALGAIGTRRSGQLASHQGTVRGSLRARNRFQFPNGNAARPSVTDASRPGASAWLECRSLCVQPPLPDGFDGDVVEELSCAERRDRDAARLPAELVDDDCAAVVQPESSGGPLRARGTRVGPARLHGTRSQARPMTRANPLP